MPAPVAGPKAPAAQTPAAHTPRGFVNTGVPQARHRSGSGTAIVVVGLLLLPAVIAAGWWALNSVRGALQTRTTASDTTSPSAVKDADPSTQKPAEPPAATTDQANQANPADPAKPGETPAETASQEQPPQTPAVDANANAATSTAKPPESQPPARPTDANQTAVASQTSQPNPAPAANQANASQNPPPDASRAALANQANASQLADARRTAQPNQAPSANQANGNPADANRPIEARDARNPEPPARDAVTDRTRETSPDAVVRDATRENTRRPASETPRETPPPVREEPAAVEPSREPATPSTPADTRSLDYGSLNAFRGGSRSTGSASSVYTDSPSTAAAVARITYALEAYGEAIAARDLDALRDVRSPVTPAETTMLKEGRLTVRFSNLDVSIDGGEARVRCRRAVVANGKTISSGPSDVRLTRRPEGWVITDIR
jgi:hypothetical protein